MSLKTSDVLADMCTTWDDMDEATPESMIRVRDSWLKYAMEYLKMNSWPIRMVKLCLRHGPERAMRPRDVLKLMLFFYGNRLSYICSGHWVLIRIATSTLENNEERAMEAITVIVKTHKMLKKNGNILRFLRYFDIQQRKYIPISR